MRPSQSDLGNKPYWLLSFTWSGQVYRFSNTPVAPIDSDGNPVQHDGGLDLTAWVQEIELLSTAPSQRSVPITVPFPVDVAEYIELGRSLDAAKGELSYWLDGMPYESRLTVLKGSVFRPQYGGFGVPVTFELRQEPYDDKVILPYANQRVTEQTFTSYPEDSEGLYYPIVYGQPGYYFDGSDWVVTEGSPALIVAVTGSSVDVLLIAGHDIYASNVTVLDASGNSEVFTTTVTKDLLGQSVATVDISGAAVISLTDDEYWIAWHDGRAHNDIKGVGSLIETLFSLSGLDYDIEATAAAVPGLDEYKVGGYLSEPCTGWQYLQDHILPIFPLSIAATQDGLYPQSWPTQTDNAVAHMKVPDVVRPDRISYDRGNDEIINEFRLEYANSKRTLIYSGENYETLPSGSQAINSFTRYGSRVESEKSVVVWDDTTAHLIAQTRIIFYALSLRSARYIGPAELIAWLRPAQVVTIDDAPIHWQEKGAIVTSVTLSLLGAALSVIVIEGIET